MKTNEDVKIVPLEIDKLAVNKKKKSQLSLQVNVETNLDEVDKQIQEMKKHLQDIENSIDKIVEKKNKLIEGGESLNKCKIGKLHEMEKIVVKE